MNALSLLISFAHPLKVVQRCRNLLAQCCRESLAYFRPRIDKKVSALNAGLGDPEFPGITYRRGSSGIPVPMLRGIGIRVQTIVISNREWKETPAKIADQYDLSESLVIEALRFFQAHQAEIDLLIQSDP